MNYLNEIIQNGIGWFHFITSVVALITGLVVILNPKGTLFHKRIGYIYVVSMLSLNVSSFFIVNFGGFSLFHFFTIVSLVSIAGGMLPTLQKKENWLSYQYCAFWSEIGTRFVGNMKEFWWMVMLATALTAAVGGAIIHTKAKKFNI